MADTVFLRGDSARSLPMKHVHHWQRIAMDIRNNDYNPANISWSKDSLFCASIAVTVDHLKSIVSQDIDDLKSLLKDCLLLPRGSDTGQGTPRLPPLDEVMDIPSQKVRGFSFLGAEANLPRVSAGKDYWP
ncbi:hypothetical protein FPOA_06316 [Fusarium poae]|uniref:Uncharacterized protein n=1 Tax=Fusarium poae TaxID=36050 RepID=A0A1B8AZ83_FUSPO|nr:hypothetical protein FPOA_06316 [Fusarium poae]